MNIRLTVYFLFALLFIQSNLISQPEVFWEVSYGGKTYDRGSSIIDLGNKEYVVCGLTRQKTSSTNNAWLIKVDSVGKIIWQQNYFLGGHCWFSNVHQTSDGGFILGGSAKTTTNDWDHWLVRTDSSGNMIWENSFGTVKRDLLRDFKPTSDNGYILTGWTGADTYSGSFNITKTDSVGERLWSKSLFIGEGYGIIESSDGNYIATGDIDRGKMCVVKVDQNGEEVWRKVFTEGIFSYGQDIMETSDGNFVAIGSEHNDEYWSHYYSRVIKFNDDGEVLWDKKIEGPAALEFNAIFETNDRGYCLAGYRSYETNGGDDIYLYKMNSDGNMQWDAIYGGDKADWAEDLIQIDNGGFVFTGWSESVGYEGDLIIYGLGPEIEWGGIKVTDFNIMKIGDEHELSIIIEDIKGNLKGITGELSTFNDSIKIIQGTSNFENNHNVMSNISDPFVISFPTNFDPNNQKIEITFYSSGDMIRKLSLNNFGSDINSRFYHQTNSIITTINNNGDIGGGESTIGFNYKNNPNAIFGGGIMVGSPTAKTHGNVRSFLFNDIKNSKVMQLLVPNDDFDMITKCTTQDSYPTYTFDLEIEQYFYSNSHDDYIFVKHSLRNTSNDPMEDIYSGLFLDWDIVTYSLNTGGFDEELKLAYQCNKTEAVDSSYYGIMILTDFGGASVVTTLASTRSMVYNLMTQVQIDSLTEGDQRTYVSSGPFNIGVSESIEADFAIVAGDDLEDLKTNAREARAKWAAGLIVNINNKNEIPNQFTLSQNYPNPFNPITTIKYSIPQKSRVELKVYDALGRDIATLINEMQQPGEYSISFDAASLSKKISSGVYLYTIKTDENFMTKKMILLK